MIELRSLTKSFRTPQGRHFVFRDLNFKFPEAANIGLIGRNGAGKSTLLRLIGGIDVPDHGAVVTDKRISFPVGLSGGFQRTMTGRDNAKFVCRIYGADSQQVREKVNFVEDFAELGKYFDMPIKTYSSGMRSRLIFGLSMAFDFDYYLMDEVGAVGDAGFKAKSQKLLEDKIGRANVICVSHGMATIRKQCDLVVLIQDGQAILYPDLEEGIRAYQGPDYQAPRPKRDAIANQAGARGKGGNKNRAAARRLAKRRAAKAMAAPRARRGLAQPAATSGTTIPARALRSTISGEGPAGEGPSTKPRAATGNLPNGGRGRRGGRTPQQVVEGAAPSNPQVPTDLAKRRAARRQAERKRLRQMTEAKEEQLTDRSNERQGVIGQPARRPAGRRLRSAIGDIQSVPPVQAPDRPRPARDRTAAREARQKPAAARTSDHGQTVPAPARRSPPRAGLAVQARSTSEARKQAALTDAPKRRRPRENSNRAAGSAATENSAIGSGVPPRASKPCMCSETTALLERSDAATTQPKRRDRRHRGSDSLVAGTTGADDRGLDNETTAKDQQ